MSEGHSNILLIKRGSQISDKVGVEWVMSAATTPIHTKEMSVVSPTSRFAHTEVDLKLFRPFN